MVLKKYNKVFLSVLGAAVAITVGRYAWNYQRNHSIESLMYRAEQYWEAIRVNDLQTAYNLEAETKAGTFLPHEVEVNPEWGLKVVQFKITNEEVKGDLGQIDVTTLLTMREFGGKTFPGGIKKDIWTFMDGEWFHGTPQVGGAGIRKKPDRYQHD